MPRPEPVADRSIAHVTLLVRDYDEAIAFYVGTLDFVLVEDTNLPGQDKRWVVVAPSGGASCSMVLARASSDKQMRLVGEQTGGRVFLFLSTDDIKRDHDLYAARGVTFVRPPQQMPYGLVAVFADLYGNLWDLIQYADGRR